MVDKPKAPVVAPKPGLPTITEHLPPTQPILYHDDFLQETFPPYFIPSDLIIFVPENKQLVNFGTLDVEGILEIDGQFFSEA